MGPGPGEGWISLHKPYIAPRRGEKNVILETQGESGGRRKKKRETRKYRDEF